MHRRSTPLATGSELDLPQYQTIISNQPTRNKKPTMRNSSISLIAVALLCLSSLPSSTAFSASLKVQGNETKISYDYKYSPSTSHDSEAEAPIEVESWTEALSSPKAQEPGTSFILQAQMHGHGEMQMETSNAGPEAVLQDAFNAIDNLTKKDLKDFCDHLLYYNDIAERWLAEIGPADLKDKVMAYLGEESGKGLADAFRDIMNAFLDAMMKNPGRRFLSEEDATLLQDDPEAFRDKGKEEIEEAAGELGAIMSNEQFSHFFNEFSNEMKGMDAEELYVNVKEAFRDTRSLLKEVKKLNPKRRNFDIRLVRCVLKHLLSPQEYWVIKRYIPLMVKNLRNAHDPLLADM